MMSIHDDITAFNGSTYIPQTLPLQLMSLTTLSSLIPRSSSLLLSQSSPSASPLTLPSSTESTTDASEDGIEGHSAIGMVLLVLVLMIIIVGTIVGNILVCVAVCLVRKLRRPYNYLLVSLAVSDLCVAVLVMPMALLYDLLGEWQFGRVACDVWVSFDVLSCTASILNLCMISVDRYLAITKPLEYGVKRTPRRMVAYILFVWICAAFVSVPPVLILGNEHGDGNICQVCQNFWYQIYATFVSFYIPLTVMVTVYYKIFQAAKRIVDEERKAQSHLRTVEEQGKVPRVADITTSNTTTHNSVTPTKTRCSVVQINNGEVETKLAPLLPQHMEEVTSKRDWSLSKPNEQQQDSFANNNHLQGSKPVAVTEPQNSRCVKNTNGSQLLEVPGGADIQHGSISPVSIITTCESNWSLIPCRDLESGNVSPSHELQEEGSACKVSIIPLHIEGNELGDKRVDDVTSPLKSASPNKETEVQEIRLEVPENRCDTLSPTKDVESHSECDTDSADLPQSAGKPFRGENFSFKQNSYTKLPSCETAPLKSPTNSKCGLPSESLLDKRSIGGNTPQRRKSSEGNGTHKKKHLIPHKSKLRITLAKERKASTTLGIIMSAFIICWLPFFVLALVRPFLSEEGAIPNIISSLFLWLGYANSLFNPIIYATLNKDFRKPFQEILCLRCSSLNILMREEFYYSQYGPDTPNHSHVRYSVPYRDNAEGVTSGMTPERSHHESIEEPMTESRF